MGRDFRELEGYPLYAVKNIAGDYDCGISRRTYIPCNRKINCLWSVNNASSLCKGSKGETILFVFTVGNPFS